MKYRTLCLATVRSTLLNRDTSGTFRILLLAAFVGIFAGYSCHASTHILSPTPEKTLPNLVVGIVARSANLNYMTEQDSEVFAFYRNTAVSETTESVFLGLLRQPAESQISRHSWSTFFQIRTQNDSTGRWRHLQEYLEAHLTDLTVFRIPRDSPYEAQYDLYAIGLFNGETVVGIQMFGVAT